MGSEEIGKVEWPSGPLPIAIIVGMSALAHVSFGPEVDELKFLNSTCMALFGSQKNTRLVLYAAAAAHVAEGVAAGVMSIRAKFGLSASLGWMLQTTLLGFPSFRLLTRKVALGKRGKI